MLGFTEELEELDWYEDKPYSPYVRVEEAVHTLQGLRRAYVYVKSPRRVPRLPKPAVKPPLHGGVTLTFNSLFMRFPALNHVVRLVAPLTFNSLFMRFSLW